MDFGGEMRFSFGGNPLILRAKFESEPTNLQIDGGANQDSSIFRTLKPEGFMAEPTFQDLPVDSPYTWNDIVRGGPYNMTLIEDQTGRLHTWTGAQFEGKARVDHMTGEMTGLKIRSQNYTKRAA